MLLPMRKLSAGARQGCFRRFDRSNGVGPRHGTARSAVEGFGVATALPDDLAAAETHRLSNGARRKVTTRFASGASANAAQGSVSMSFWR